MEKTFKLMCIVLCLGCLAIGSTAIAENVNYNGGKYGTGILYSSDEIITWTFDVNGIIIGIFGKNWDMAEERDSGTSNYGRTKIGEVNDSVIGFDLGYSWKINKYLRVGVEGTYAYVTQYDKYKDYRFSENYYLDKTDSENQFGGGILIGIPIHRHIELIGSANSVKGVGGGLIFRW